MDIVKKLISHIEQWRPIAPILFLGRSSSATLLEIEKIKNEIISFFGLDFSIVQTLVNDGEKIKVQKMKEFIAQSFVKSSFGLQIFVIEDISRFTLEASNASLKFLEEPWVGNIVFLTSDSESGVLDTILSRVQIQYVSWESQYQSHPFFYDMIDDYLQKRNFSLLSYFYEDKKIEKKDYLDFLQTFFCYIQSHPELFKMWEIIEQSLQNILKNNALAKYEIDKILLFIKNTYE